MAMGEPIVVMLLCVAIGLGRLRLAGTPGSCRRQDLQGQALSPGLVDLMLPGDHPHNFVRHTGTTPHDAIRCVTHNPAESIGLGEKMGLLAPGHNADLVLWDDQLRIRRV